MKQKYTIALSDRGNELIIKESGELDKGIFTPVFEQAYDKEIIQTACEKDDAALVQVFRTTGFYPISACAKLIAAGIREFFETGCVETKEVSFNDVSVLQEKVQEELLEEIDDPVELDNLLEDESKIEADDLLGDDDISPISSSASSIKIADDDSIQTDDDL